MNELEFKIKNTRENEEGEENGGKEGSCKMAALLTDILQLAIFSLMPQLTFHLSPFSPNYYNKSKQNYSIFSKLEKLNNYCKIRGFKVGKPEKL